MKRKKSIHSSLVKDVVSGYVWMIVVPVTVVLIVGFAFASQYVYGASVNTVEMIQGEVRNKYKDELRRASLSLSRVMNLNDGSTISQAASAEDNEEKAQALEQLDTMYHILAAPEYRLRDIQIYRKDGMTLEPRWTMKDPSGVLRQEQWYQTALNQPGQVYASMENKEYFYRLPLGEDLMVIAAMAPRTMPEVDCVVLYQLSEIPDLIKKYNKNGTVGKTLIVGSDGMAVTGGKEGIAPEIMNRITDSQDKTVQISWQRERYIASAVPDSEWYLVSVVNESSVFGKFRLLSMVCTLVIVGVVGLFIVYYRRYMNQLLVPLQRLTDGMKEVEQHHLDIQVEMCRQQDIARMIATFNRMVTQIGQLMIEKETAEKEKYQEELLALQSRMNPHFIMNTLNTLKMMAISAHFDSMRDMVTALETILAAILNREEGFYTVEEEVLVLGSYIEIMQFRYMDSFEVEIDIASEVRSCNVPKLILQPIVENCITHGFDSSKEELWDIRVTGYEKDGCLVFEVLDNGVGMTPEKILEVLAGEGKTGSRHSIGVSNTNRRLKLNFGQEYGVTIQSEPGRYTKMTLTMPVIRNGEDEDVSCIDCR